VNSVTYEYGIGEDGSIRICGAIRISTEAVRRTDDEFESVIENEAMHLGAEMKAELRKYRKEVLAK